MKLKKGFSPLEILLALTIFSFLGTLLFQSLFQVNKSLRSVTEITSADRRYLLFDNLWEKELTGAFVPEVKKVGQEENEEPQDQQQGQNKKEKKEEKLEMPPKAFFYESDGGNLKLFTFITTNPLAVYNMRKPRLMRIVYELRPEQAEEGSFALYRKEVENIFEEQEIEGQGAGKTRSFKVMSGIQELKVEFYAELVKKKQKEDGKDKTDKKEESEQKEKEPREFNKVESWDKESVEKLAEEDKAVKPVPAFIKVTLKLYTQGKETDEREYIFAPLYDQQAILLKGIKPLEDPKKQQAKGSQGKAPPQMPGANRPPVSGRPGQAGSRNMPPPRTPGRPGLRGSIAGGMQR